MFKRIIEKIKAWLFWRKFWKLSEREQHKILGEAILGDDMPKD